MAAGGVSDGLSAIFDDIQSLLRETRQHLGQSFAATIERKFNLASLGYEQVPGLVQDSDERRRIVGLWRVKLFQAREKVNLQLAVKASLLSELKFMASNVMLVKMDVSVVRARAGKGSRSSM